jgi:hypothetical protein
MFQRLLLFAVMSLPSLFGCSRHSTELPSSLSELRLEISIKDETERGDDTPDDSRQSISAVLRNAKGGEIERADVALEVNGVPLEFRVATGNYYDRHPYYQLPKDSKVRVTAGIDYHFVLILPDGSHHEVGTVRTPSEFTAAQFDFPKRRPPAGEINLAWRELTEAATLTLFRSDRYRDGDTRVFESGSATDPTALRREIGPGLLRRRSDQWTVPVDFLATKDGHELRSLGAEILISHEGKVSKTFARESSLRAERRLTLRMECAMIE